MTTLWRIKEGGIESIAKDRLENERDLEVWIEDDPSILNPDLMIIGRQVETGFGRIDLLGISSDGSLQIIELKRDRTPRDVVAQILDYASWISKLVTADVHQIAGDYARSKGVQEGLSEQFRTAFDVAIPEVLNSSHGMLVVASALDASSKRIVEYLSQHHKLAINTAFFNTFTDGANRYLSADWLMDQQQVIARTETRTKAPWTGVWYVNAGDGPHRSWEDMRKYGFIAAGGGRTYSGKLDLLSPGDLIFVYQKQMGYVGTGTVEGSAVRAEEFTVDGQPLLSLPLSQPNLAHNKESEEEAEYVVSVKWMKTFALADARTFPGAFANQNVVCRLRDPATLDFLTKTFSTSGQVPD